MIISSNIPINSGLSSSTALIIVWINFLFKAFGKKSISPKEIAQIAYEVEVIEQKSSGGKMDHFTISLGNTIYLDTKTDKVTSYKKLDLELVVGVSGLAKDTLGSLNHLKLNAVKAIKQVQKKIPNFEKDIFDDLITDPKIQDIALLESRHAAAVDGFHAFECAKYDYWTKRWS